MENDFQSFLAAKLKEKNLSLKRLSEISGIALKHIENMNSGNFEDLPATPYIRGYLKRMAEILDFDPEPWWQNLKQAAEIKTSGKEDLLPKNRFIKKSPAKKIIIIVIGLIVLSYFGFRFSKILGQPEITITYPQGEGILISSNPEIAFQGALKNGDKIIVNGEDVPINNDGSWQKNIPLKEGVNNVEIIAKKFLGRETKIVRQIVYESAGGNGKKNNGSSAATSTSSSTLPETNSVNP